MANLALSVLSGPKMQSAESGPRVQHKTGKLKKKHAVLWDNGPCDGHRSMCAPFTPAGARSLLLSWDRLGDARCQFPLESNANNDPLIAKYECHKHDTLNTNAKNRWHYVKVVAEDGERNKYRWLNEAGVGWMLHRTNDKSKLALGPDCPYFNTTRHVEIIADPLVAVRALKFQGELYHKLPAAHSAPPMLPTDYFRLARSRDIVSQRQILAKYRMAPTTPVDLLLHALDRATFHKTRDGAIRARAVVVSGSPSPTFNGVYSAKSSEGVYGFYKLNGYCLQNNTSGDCWQLVDETDRVHAWCSNCRSSGLPTGTREWHYKTAGTGADFRLTVTALPVLSAPFQRQVSEAADCARQWARVLGGFANGGSSELVRFLGQFVGLRRMLGRVLLQYYSPFTASSFTVVTWK